MTPEKIWMQILMQILMQMPGRCSGFCSGLVPTFQCKKYYTENSKLSNIFEMLQNQTVFLQMCLQLWGFRSCKILASDHLFWKKWLYVLLGQNIRKNRRVFVSLCLYLILHGFQNVLEAHTSAVRCLNFLCFASSAVFV